MPGLTEEHDLGISFRVTRSGRNHRHSIRYLTSVIKFRCSLPSFHETVMANVYQILTRILCFAGITIPSLLLRRQGRDVSTLDMKPFHLTLWAITAYHLSRTCSPTITISGFRFRVDLSR